MFLWISTDKSELCPAYSLRTLGAPLGELQVLRALIQNLGTLLRTLGEPPLCQNTQKASFSELSPPKGSCQRKFVKWVLKVILSCSSKIKWIGFGPLIIYYICIFFFDPPPVNQILKILTRSQVCLFYDCPLHMLRQSLLLGLEQWNVNGFLHNLSGLNFIGEAAKKSSSLNGRAGP